MRAVLLWCVLAAAGCDAAQPPPGLDAGAEADGADPEDAGDATRDTTPGADPVIDRTDPADCSGRGGVFCRGGILVSVYLNDPTDPDGGCTTDSDPPNPARFCRGSELVTWSFTCSDRPLGDGDTAADFDEAREECPAGCESTGEGTARCL